MSADHTIIQGERILLDQLKITDWQMISFLRSDEQVNTFVERPKAETKQKAIQFIQKINKGRKNNESYFWAIRVQSQIDLVGTICLWNFSEDRKAAELGYELSPAFQKKGLMTEAIELVLKFAQRDLSLDSISAYTHRQNTASTKLLKKFGFKLDKNTIDENNKNNIIFVKYL